MGLSTGIGDLNFLVFPMRERSPKGTEEKLDEILSINRLDNFPKSLIKLKIS